MKSALPLVVFLITSLTPEYSEAEDTRTSIAPELIGVPTGRLAGTPDLESTSTTLAPTSGIAASIRIPFKSHFYVAFAPQVIWGVKDADHDNFRFERDRGRRGQIFNLLMRTGFSWPIASNLNVGAAFDIGFSRLGGSLNSSDAAATGVVTGLALTADAKLNDNWSLRPRIGYQWGFQSQSDEDDTVDVNINSRLLQIGLGFAYSI